MGGQRGREGAVQPEVGVQQQARRAVGVPPTGRLRQVDQDRDGAGRTGAPSEDGRCEGGQEGQGQLSRQHLHPNQSPKPDPTQPNSTQPNDHHTLPIAYAGSPRPLNCTPYGTSQPRTHPYLNSETAVAESKVSVVLLGCRVFS